jgi:hypothetical protein
MKKITTAIVILFFPFLLSVNVYSSPADSVSTVSKENLCKNWVLKEYKENGKAQNLYEYEIEFFTNGKYVETEEGETEKGVWEFNENNTAIVFDKSTLDQDEWIIEILEAGKFSVKFSDEDKNYRFIMIPAK